LLQPSASTVVPAVDGTSTDVAKPQQGVGVGAESSVPVHGDGAAGVGLGTAAATVADSGNVDATAAEGVGTAVATGAAVATGSTAVAPATAAATSVAPGASGAVLAGKAPGKPESGQDPLMAAEMLLALTEARY
jgi:hypothetical protein